MKPLGYTIVEMHQEMYYQKEKKTAIISSWILFSFSLFFIFSYSLEKLSLIPQSKEGSLGPLAPILFFLYAACLLCLVYSKFLKLIKVFALTAILISLFSTTLDLIAGMLPFLKNTTIYGFPRLFWGATMSNCLSALIFLTWPYKKRTAFKSSLQVILISFVLLMAIDGAALFLLPTTDGTIFSKNLVHPSLAISHLILSVGLISRNLYEDGIKKIRLQKWFIPIFSISMILFHAILFLGLVYEQRDVLKKSLNTKTESIQKELTLNLEKIDSDLNSFTQRIKESKNFTQNTFLYEASQYLQEENSLKGIALIGSDFTIRYSQTKKDSLDINLFLSYLQRHLPSEKESIEKPITLYSPLNRMLFIVGPIFSQGVFNQGVVFEIDLSALTKELKNIKNADGYHITILCNSFPLFSADIEDTGTLLDLSAVSNFSYLDFSFSIKAQISKNLFFIKLVNSLILTIILGGVIGGILMGSIFYLIQALKEKALFSKVVTEQLALSDSILKKMNEATTIHEACEKILQILHQVSGWSLLFHWSFESNTKKIRLDHIASIPKDSYILTEKAFRTLSYDEIDPLKECLETKEPIWCDDISLKSLKGSDAAIKEGLKGVFILPLFEKREPVGAIQIFRSQRIDSAPDDSWVETMKTIGYEMSLFIQKRKASLIDKELNALIKQSRDAIFKVDLSQIIQTWNLGAEIIYGWRAEEIIGKSIDVIFRSDDYKEIDIIKEQILKKKSIEHLKRQRVKKDGELIWTESSSSPLIDEKGSVVGCSVIARDITQEKLAQDALKASEEKFRLFVESTRSWIWEVDTQGLFTFSNPAVSRILGFNHVEILSKSFLSFALDRQKLQKLWDDNVISPHGWKQRLWQATTKEGSSVWLESTADPIYDSLGNWIGFRGVERDVTDEVNMSRSKSEFISMVSHELRSPLTSIMGALGLLKQQPHQDKSSLELVQLADRNAKRLLNLINDILDIEKLTLGKMQFHLKEHKLSHIISEAIKVSETQAKEADISIIEETPLQEIEVLVDYDRLLQVILNLLSNAIKFCNPSSEVIIKMSLLDEMVRVSVKDSGAGIPYEIQGKIFQRFIQGKSGDTKVKGTGLGLNISKEIIEKMKGSIGFVSEPGKGCEFFCDLPIIKR